MGEPIMRWLVRWAAMCHSRFHKGVDKRSATKGRLARSVGKRYFPLENECGSEDFPVNLKRKLPWTPSGVRVSGWDTTEEAMSH